MNEECVLRCKFMERQCKESGNPIFFSDQCCENAIKAPLIKNLRNVESFVLPDDYVLNIYFDDSIDTYESNVWGNVCQDLESTIVRFPSKNIPLSDVSKISFELPNVDVVERSVEKDVDASKDDVELDVNMNMENDDDGNDNRVVLIVVLCIIFIFVLLVLYYLFIFRKNKKNSKDGNKKS